MRFKLNTRKSPNTIPNLPTIAYFPFEVLIPAENVRITMKGTFLNPPLGFSLINFIRIIILPLPLFSLLSVLTRERDCCAGSEDKIIEFIVQDPLPFPPFPSLPFLSLPLPLPSIPLHSLPFLSLPLPLPSLPNLVY